MDEKRKGEIAYAFLKLRTREAGIHLNPGLQSLQNELGDISKTTSISVDELKVFLKSLAEELLREAFD